MEELVNQVLSIDSSNDPDDIRLDLEYTKSVEVTLNRIFDGKFLEGINRNTVAKELIILDSDDEDTLDYSYSNGDLSMDKPLDQGNKKRVDYSLWNDDSSIDELLNSVDNENTLDYSLLHDDVSIDKPVNKDDNRTTLDYPQWDKDVSIDEPLKTDDGEPSNYDLTLSPVKVYDIDEPLLSEDDFFNELLSIPTKKHKRLPLVEKREVVDRKGKGKASDIDIFEVSDEDDISMPVEISLKERKRQEKAEQKSQKQKMLEEKKLKRMEQMKQKQEEKQKRLLEKEKTAHFEKENRLKNNRKETLKEMIVDIHPDFLSTPTGESVQKLLTEREVTIQPLAASSKYSLSWKRKCTAEWNADSQTFIPISDTKIEEEACLLVYLNTDQFVQAIQSNTLDTRIDSIQQAYPNHQIMLVIEGLEAYYKKQSLIQKRQFQSQVLESLGPMLDGSSSSSRKRKKTADIELGLSQKSIEEYLVHLQLIKKVMHVCTKDGEDSASWIENFTADLAVGRYNKKNLNQAIKVMKSGTDPNDTYFKMLQEVQLCTPAIANSIISEYPTLNSLHQAYENEPPHNRGLMLAHLEVQRSVVRARDRTINRVMSNKIYKLFNSEDPNEEIS